MQPVANKNMHISGTIIFTIIQRTISILMHINLTHYKIQAQTEFSPKSTCYVFTRNWYFTTPPSPSKTACAATAQFGMP